MGQSENSQPGVLKNRLPSLDGLRAISIILVIISHFLFEQSVYINKWKPGPTGVEIFFVISGFLITTLLINEKNKNGTINLKLFYLRRAFRILPLVFLFTFCLIILNAIFALNINFSSFITTIFFTKNVGNLFFGTDWYTGHFGSLAVEEQFYMLFPFLIYKFSIKTYSKILGCLILFLPVLNYLVSNKIGIFQSSHSLFKICFIITKFFGSGTVSILIGSLCSILYNRFQPQLELLFKFNYLGFVLFLAAMSLRLPIISDSFSRFFVNVVFDFLIGAMIIANLNLSSFFSHFLNHTIMVKIGVLSYSLYVWQQLFTHQQPWAQLHPLFSTVLFNLPVLIIVAYLSYEFFEKKFLILKQRFNVINK
jgi:peptidoglycan/LPS O-acetylase OafA/YrhL